MAIDGEGDVYVTGWFSSLTDFGGGTVVPENSSRNQNLFVASYTGDDGSFRWVTTRSDAARSHGLDIGVTSEGDAIITGDRELVGNVLEVPQLVLAKYASESGEEMWFREWGGDKWDYGRSVAVGPRDEITVGGWFAGPSDFGAESPLASSSGGPTESVIALYDTDGSHIWSHRFGGDVSLLTGIAVDGDGGTYATGRHLGTTDLAESFETTSNGLYDAFLIHLAPSGEPAFAAS